MRFSTKTSSSKPPTQSCDQPWKELPCWTAEVWDLGGQTSIRPYWRRLEPWGSCGIGFGQNRIEEQLWIKIVKNWDVSICFKIFQYVESFESRKHPLWWVHHQLPILEPCPWPKPLVPTQFLHRAERWALNWKSRTVPVRCYYPNTNAIIYVGCWDLEPRLCILLEILTKKTMQWTIPHI